MTPGERLEASVRERYELNEAEAALLVEACRTLDLCASLQVELDEAEPLVVSPQGLRAHPAAVELRQQRIALARLFAALRIPLADEENGEAPRLQRRGPRGAYGFGAA